MNATHPKQLQRTASYAALIVVLLLSACQEDLILDVALPEPEAELVVNSLFNPDSLWEVYVNTTAPLLGTANPAPVTTARVEILEEGAVIDVLPYDRTVLIESLPYEYVDADGNGARVAIYRSLTRRPEVGKTYGIRVTADGFDPVSGIGSLPRRVPIMAATFTDNVGTDEVGTLAEVRLTFDDPGGAANYYNLRVHTRGVDRETNSIYSLSYGFNVVSDLQDDFFGADPNDFLGDREIFEVKEDGVTFSDVFFDGQRKEVVLQLRGGPLCGFAEGTSFDCEVVVELSAVTEAFYRYHRTLQLQVEASENPFAESLRIYSNMNNGVGIFAGYNTALWILER